MSKKKVFTEKELENIENETILFKAYVPKEDADLLMDWKDNCKLKKPYGFADYHWKKMLHDHLFTKNYLSSISIINARLETLESKLNLILEKLNKSDANGNGISKSSKETD